MWSATQRGCNKEPNLWNTPEIFDHKVSCGLKINQTKVCVFMSSVFTASIIKNCIYSSWNMKYGRHYGTITPQPFYNIREWLNSLHDVTALCFWWLCFWWRLICWQKLTFIIQLCFGWMETLSWRQQTERGGGLTAGADVALVAVEEAVSDPDVRPRGRVA